MITLEESIPTKNESYRLAEDVFYIQFNDVSFFIEDEEQENFYYNILSKLFPEIKIEKIFPLNGKDNVIKECKSNVGNKKKIYIVDKDFDDVFERKECIINLFYLERYSIENYLIEFDSLVEYIISEKPKIKRDIIYQEFDLNKAIKIVKNSLNELMYLFLLVQKKCPRKRNISLSYERFFDFDDGNFAVREDQFNNYIIEIETELREVDKRVRFKSQLNKLKKEISIDSEEFCIIHYPGKFIVKMIKQIIESTFGLNSRNFESFCYRIASNCTFNSFEPLRLSINDYII